MRLTRIVKLYKQAKKAEENKLWETEKQIILKRRNSSIILSKHDLEKFIDRMKTHKTYSRATVSDIQTPLYPKRIDKPLIEFQVK